MAMIAEARIPKGYIYAMMAFSAFTRTWICSRGAARAAREHENFKNIALQRAAA
jgi:hypothetical protein